MTVHSKQTITNSMWGEGALMFGGAPLPPPLTVKKEK